jgi:DNA polymerase-3 subunit gamma/tau
MKTPTHYITFARKYRPINFSELQGQEVLTKILSYAIVNNRLAQGYLLTGIRGVGKTSSARIIAKTINCTELVVGNDNVRACERCPNCQGFNECKHPDIIEIDAASRTSVDDIRQIIESSEYRPFIGKYKVFIIDEVHMLSKGAFNALLKILEEPPQHVIFIFATTEVQKIPLTVISRCQRYDLRRLTFNEILQLLEQIKEKEKLQFDTEALRIIASKSDGSARDAIAMLDQATSFSGNSQAVVSAKMINQMLGLVETSAIINFISNIINKDSKSAIELVNNIYLLSFNLEIFVGTVSDFLAYLSKVKMLTIYHDPIYDPFSKEIADILVKTSFSQLSILWQIYIKGIQEIKLSHNQLMAIEMLVMKSIYSQMLPLPEDLASIHSQPKVADQTISSFFVTTHETAKIDSVDSDSTRTSSDHKHNLDLIMNFLNYLHNNNEIEIYYLLLNQVEIKNFSNYTLEIAGENINHKLKERINELLFKWAEKKWQVIVTKQSQISTLKEKLINKVKSTESWQLVNEHFSSAMISDILKINSEDK